jgi:hypothetical protein
MQNGNDKSRGLVRIEHLFNAEEIGVSVPEPHPDRALRIFLDAAAPAGHIAIAPRVSQMSKGVLLLQAVEGEPASGAIYIYNRASGEFLMVTFDGGDDDHLTVSEFELLVREYGLLEYAARPDLITPPIQETGKA